MKKEGKRQPRGARLLQLTSIAMAAALISVCAWLTVPGVIPFTMQTFAVFFVLLFLGGKAGTIAVLLYLAIGAMGFPVFSNFSGGLGILLGPTGGYLIGFLFSALCYWATERWTGAHRRFLFLVLPLMMVLCYACGTVWYCVYFAGERSVMQAILACVVPFLLPDGCKITLAWFLSAVIRRQLRAHRD